MAASDSPTPQFDALVGPAASAVRDGLVAALQRGNTQANDAYDFSPHSDGFTYGTNRWRFCLAEVGLALETIEGARQLNPRNSRMWVVGKTVCYPVCYANDAQVDVESATIRPSRLRQDLFAKLGRLSPYVQLELDFDADFGASSDEEHVEDVESEDLDLVVDEYLSEASRELPRMIVVAYASNRHAGLLRAHVGEAVMADNGRLYWAWIEELPVSEDGIRLRLVPDAAVPVGFADAPEPELDIRSGFAPDVTPEEVKDRPHDVKDGRADE